MPLATLRGWVYSRKIEVVYIGSRIKLREETIEEIIERGTTRAIDWWGHATEPVKVSSSQPKFIPIREAAEMMNIPAVRLRRWIALGKIEVVRIGRKITLKEETIQHVIDHGMPARPRPKPYGR
jgi:excisionase family DNA binding protein